MIPGDQGGGGYQYQLVNRAGGTPASGPSLWERLLKGNATPKPWGECLDASLGVSDV